MGTLIGHIAPGAGFVLIGLWHLYNTIRNYAQAPWDFETRPWFPTKLKGTLKYMELYAIMFGSCLSIAAELFIGPKKHQPLADDWSIPPEHLNNFEHSTISLFFFIYAAVSLCVELAHFKVPHGLLHVLGAFAFSQQLLLFHLHSADHMGLEGQYHWLLQLIVFVSLTCTLLEIARPRGFLVAMVRAMSILFQGFWFIQMGLVLWIPAFIPKGCEPNREGGHGAVTCAEDGSLMRAKALANLEFSWYLAGVSVFTVVCYVVAMKVYGLKVRYELVDDENGEAKDIEVGEHRRSLDGSQSSMEGLPGMNYGR